MAAVLGRHQQGDRRLGIPNGSSYQPLKGRHKMDARAIVHNWAGMVARPEYTSGRGATTSDLNSTQLEQIYEGVKQNVGQEAATNFAQMVADLTELSATGFLLSLYDLEASGWRWVHQKKKPVNIALDGRDDELVLSGMCTIFSAFGRGDRDDTPFIRASFLRNHEKELIFDEDDYASTYSDPFGFHPRRKPTKRTCSYKKRTPWLRGPKKLRGT